MPSMIAKDAVTAGQLALAEGRWEDARHAFLRVAEDDGGLPGALVGLGEVSWWTGQTADGLQYLERGFVAARRNGDPAVAAYAAILLGITWSSNYGNGTAARGWVRRARRLIEESGDDALCCWLLVTEAYVAENPEQGAAHAQAAIDAAQRAGDLGAELCARSGLGRCLEATGSVSEGLGLIDEAMAGIAAGEWEHPNTVAFVGCDMLVACDHARDLERARQWCEALKHFIARYGCPYLYAKCRAIYGGLLFGSGDWAGAEHELRAAVAIAEGSTPSVGSHARVQLAELLARCGRYAEALELVSECSETDSAIPGAIARVARGQPRLAAALLERRLRAGDADAGAARALDELVAAYFAAGDLDAASEASGRLAALPSEGDSWRPGATAFAAGRVALCRGKPGVAADHLESALLAFQRANASYDVARSRRWLAEALRGTHPELAAVEGRKALVAFEQLGAAPDADATAAFLRSLESQGRCDGNSAGVLTEREREVLRLLRDGLSNPEIASRLVISRKTASHHVSNVLAKLQVSTRAAAAARAARLFDD